MAGRPWRRPMPMEMVSSPGTKCPTCSRAAQLKTMEPNKKNSFVALEDLLKWCFCLFFVVLCWSLLWICECWWVACCCPLKLFGSNFQRFLISVFYVLVSWFSGCSKLDVTTLAFVMVFVNFPNTNAQPWNTAVCSFVVGWSWLFCELQIASFFSQRSGLSVGAASS